jgi:1-acyl-sn-glycerol-3-phosphate acyltransferase
MKPLDYFFDTPASGPGHYPQRFRRFIFAVIGVIFTPLFRFKYFDRDGAPGCRPVLDTGPSGRPQQKDEMAVGNPQDEKPQTGYIIAANHQSYLDPVFLILSLKPTHVRFIAKESFLRVPVIKRFAAWAGVFPLKRGTADMKAVKRAVAMLKRGENLGIFPEGTRIRTPDQERTYHEGIALIAHLSKASVIPARIWGTERISPKGKPFWRFPRITLKYGEPLSLTEERFAQLPKDERMTAFTQAVMDAIYNMEDPRA